MTIEDAPLSEESLGTDPEMTNPTPDVATLGAALVSATRLAPTVRRSPNKRRTQPAIPWGGEELGWRNMAKCVGEDSDLFLSDKEKERARATIFCSRCVVKEACLEYALESDQAFGIWGGMDNEQRRKYKKGASKK